LLKSSGASVRRKTHPPIAVRRVRNSSSASRKHRSGEVVLEQRIRTQRERLGELLSKRPKARLLLEASTESK
jgi:hypothetical protein